MIKEAKRMGSKMLLGAVVVLMSFATSAMSQGPGGPMSAEALAEAALHKTVVAGDSWIVDKTTTLKSLKVEEGAAITAPADHSLTLTVDGVEKDILPGKYQGNIVLTVTDQHVVKFSDTLIHHFRQALFLDKNGIVDSKSVLAAAGDYKLNDGVLTGANIKSVGQNFNGLLATGGTYTVKGLNLNFEGNGGNDFAGYGAAVMSDGKGTTLILDGANIFAHGAVRTTVVANNTSNLIAKNSTIAAKTGVLPDDYVSNVSPGEMKDAPWMLSIKGNVRATNLLGNDTVATYINDDLSSDGWGVLSIDSSQNTHLTAINSKIRLTGEAGYGAFAIGDSTDIFYGDTFTVPSYALISTGGKGIFGASTAENVARLNKELDMHLSPAELAAMPVQQTTVNSARFGVMMRGDTDLKIADGTVFNTDEDSFLVKGVAATIDVDGSKGAQLNAKNGVILQAIDDDDPGPITVNGTMVNRGVHHDPTDAPVKAKDFVLTETHKSDIVAKFSNITLKGDFYNAIRGASAAAGGPGGAPGGAAGGPGGAPGGAAGGPGGPGGAPGGAAAAGGKNLFLTFENSKVAGVITSSSAKHVKDPIAYEDYKMLGEVTNTPGSAVNNGVNVNLTKSTWTVTGTSYLTSLTIGNGSSVAAPAGQKVTLKVNGKAKPVKAGAYKGEIVLQVAP
jgi:hypothetical protein